MTKRTTSVTIRDVAREAGVSVATVSRYINQNVPVSETLSRRIQLVMDRLDYVPQAAARHLALRKKNTIGLLLTNMRNQFFAPLLAGIESTVGEQGYYLLVATHQSDPRSDERVPLGRHNTDGLLVFADSLSDERINRLYERRFPLVLIHRTPNAGVEVPFVTVENKAATRALIEHLIVEHGRRKIILMRGPEGQEDAYWRERGYREALDAHDIPFRESLALRGSFERHIACETLRRFLRDPDHPEFDAVFAGDDEAAVGVYDALIEAGLRIPQDVSVVGFDDSLLAPFLTPPLTTIRAPTQAVGSSAAQRLLCLLEGKIPEPVTLHPTEIILRQSCGCEASHR